MGVTDSLEISSVSGSKSNVGIAGGRSRPWLAPRPPENTPLMKPRAPVSVRLMRLPSEPRLDREPRESDMEPVLRDAG